MEILWTIREKCASETKMEKSGMREILHFPLLLPMELFEESIDERGKCLTRPNDIQGDSVPPTSLHYLITPCSDSIFYLMHHNNASYVTKCQHARRRLSLVIHSSCLRSYVVVKWIIEGN